MQVEGEALIYDQSGVPSDCLSYCCQGRVYTYFNDNINKSRVICLISGVGIFILSEYGRAHERDAESAGVIWGNLVKTFVPFGEGLGCSMAALSLPLPRWLKDLFQSVVHQAAFPSFFALTTAELNPSSDRERVIEYEWMLRIAGLVTATTTRMLAAPLRESQRDDIQLSPITPEDTRAMPIQNEKLILIKMLGQSILGIPLFGLSYSITDEDYAKAFALFGAMYFGKGVTEALWWKFLSEPLAKREALRCADLGTEETEVSKRLWVLRIINQFAKPTALVAMGVSLYKANSIGFIAIGSAEGIRRAINRSEFVHHEAYPTGYSLYGRSDSMVVEIADKVIKVAIAGGVAVGLGIFTDEMIRGAEESSSDHDIYTFTLISFVSGYTAGYASSWISGMLNRSDQNAPWRNQLAHWFVNDPKIPFFDFDPALIYLMAVSQGFDIGDEAESQMDFKTSMLAFLAWFFYGAAGGMELGKQQTRNMRPYLENLPFLALISFALLIMESVEGLVGFTESSDG